MSRLCSLLWMKVVLQNIEQSSFAKQKTNSFRIILKDTRRNWQALFPEFSIIVHQNSFCIESSPKERDQLINQDCGLKTPLKRLQRSRTLTRRWKSFTSNRIKWRGLVAKNFWATEKKTRKWIKKTTTLTISKIFHLSSLIIQP